MGGLLHDVIYFSGGVSLFGPGSFKCIRVFILDFLYSVVYEYLAVDNRSLGVFEVVTTSVKGSVVICGFLVHSSL